MAARSRRAMIVGAAIAALAADVRAQASLELNGQRVRYGDTLTSGAASISSGYHVERGRVAFDVNGTLTRFQAGGSSLHGSALGSVLTPRYRALFGEFGGSAAASSHDGGAGSSKLLAFARAHVAAPGRGVWTGFAAGSANDGVATRSILQGDVGAWARFANVTLSLSVTPTTVISWYDYVDSELAATVRAARADAWATVGFRAGDEVTISGADARTWASAGTAFWILPRAAVTLAVGSYAPDYAQRFPGGRFVSAGVRIARRPWTDTTARSVAPRQTPIEHFDVAYTRGGIAELRVRTTAARLVEIRGDFTSWVTVPMERDGAQLWYFRLPRSPGVYEFTVRVDGGEWVVPPGAESVSDEFGGRAAVVVVD